MKYSDTERDLDILALGDEVSLLHFRMVALIEAMDPGGAGTSGRRAVLRNLIANGGATVPDLAALRPVTRQAMQATINALAADGLVARHPNPRSRRSPIWRPTAAGREWLETIQSRERPFLSAAAAATDLRRVADAVALIRELRDFIDDRLAHMTGDER